MEGLPGIKEITRDNNAHTYTWLNYLLIVDLIQHVSTLAISIISILIDWIKYSKTWGNGYIISADEVLTCACNVLHGKQLAIEIGYGHFLEGTISTDPSESYDMAIIKFFKQPFDLREIVMLDSSHPLKRANLAS